MRRVKSDSKPRKRKYEAKVETDQGQLVFPGMEELVEKRETAAQQRYRIRKGLFVKSRGTKGRIYRIMKTTRKMAHLQALDSGKIVVLERKSLYEKVVSIGHQLDPKQDLHAFHTASLH